MMQIKIEHGSPFGEAYSVKVYAIDVQTKKEVHAVFELPGLDRLSKKLLDQLMLGITTAYHDCAVALNNVLMEEGK